MEDAFLLNTMLYLRNKEKTLGLALNADSTPSLQELATSSRVGESCLYSNKAVQTWEWQSNLNSAQGAQGKMPDEFVNTAGVMGLICV